MARLGKIFLALLAAFICVSCTDVAAVVSDAAAIVSGGHGAARSKIDCYFHENATGPTGNNEVVYREHRYQDGSAIAELTVKGLGFASKAASPGSDDISSVCVNEIGPAPPPQSCITTWHNDGTLHVYDDNDGSFTLSMATYCSGTGFNHADYGF